MVLFYTPDINSNLYILSEEESRHCQKVLRLREGDTIYLSDGLGTLFEARISSATGRQVSVEVIHKQVDYGRRNYKLHMAVAPTKNIERFEWFLEKATEIGVDEITPLLCEHSERRHLRPDRLVKIITAAMKQSLKAYHPVLHPLSKFEEFITAKRHGQLFIAHLEDKQPVLLQELYGQGNETTILIGPEGDFSQEEIRQAKQADYNVVSLGNSRLRTETAALAACHTIEILNSRF